MDEEAFLKLTQLCHISCTEEEKREILKSLEKILSYVNQLRELDTAQVLPCTSPIKREGIELREDLPDLPLSKELFLANAPAHVGSMVRVPLVMKQE